MLKEIGDYVKSCEACQKSKPNTPYHGGVCMPVSTLFNTWSVDFVGPLQLNSTGKKCVIIAVDYIKDWPFAGASLSAYSDVFVTFVRQKY